MTSFPAANLITTAIFVLCLVTMALGAALAVMTARLIRSVCGLAICCIGLAGLYYFLHSPFLALMEILIYVGAVCVTIVFAVMLAEPEEPPRTEKSGATLAWGGLATLIVCAFFCGLVWLGVHAAWATPAALVNDGSIAAIGRALLTTYSMAFELISLALLVAILGALAIARTGRTGAAPIQGDPAGLQSPAEPSTPPSSFDGLTLDEAPPKSGTPSRSAELVS